MSDDTAVSPFFTDLKRELHDLCQNLAGGWRQFAVTTRNQMRQLQSAKLDYIILPMAANCRNGTKPPRSFIQRQLPLPPPPLSLEILNRRLQAIADADNVKGIVFIFAASAPDWRHCKMSAAPSSGCKRRAKKSSSTPLTWTWPIISSPPPPTASSSRPALHLMSSVYARKRLFFKDALARIGVGAEAIQISPYKTASNMLSKADMTPEQQEQLDWLLDERLTC